MLPPGDDRRDFVSLALVAPVVFVVTLLATYIPARRFFLGISATPSNLHPPPATTYLSANCQLLVG